MKETSWRESGRNISGKAILVVSSGAIAAGSLALHDRLASGQLSTTQALAHQGLTPTEFEGISKLPEPLRKAGVYLEYTPAACDQSGKCTKEQLPNIPRAIEELDKSAALAQDSNNSQFISGVEQIFSTLETPLDPSIPITVETHSGQRLALETLASDAEIETENISDRAVLIKNNSKNTSGKTSLAIAVVAAGFFGAVLGRVTHKRKTPNIDVEISQ